MLDCCSNAVITLIDMFELEGGGGMDLQPERPSSALDQQSSPTVDSYLSIARIIDVVVRSPQPIVLHVQSCRTGGNMHAYVRADTR